MKKILPIIITLVGLSLLGLVILQASWLNNLVLIRESQIAYKIQKAEYDVVSTINKQLYNSTNPKISKNLQNFMLKDDYLSILKPKLVSQYFTTEEVRQLIHESFEKEDLKKLQFEFAVIDSRDESEVYSKGFEKLFLDTSNRKNFPLPIINSMSNTDPVGITERLEILVPNFRKQVWGSLTWMLIGGGLFTLIIFAAFYITMSTLLRQKKISEIKSDFINNMTHEFKTPIATISLAVDAIRNEKVQADTNKLQYFANIIKEENKRMNKQVETILQAALMEKKEIQLASQKINANIILASVVDTYQLQLNEKQATVSLQLNAQNDVIVGDELHFTNIVSNLIDNAIKYSKENLHLVVRSFNQYNQYVLEVEDNGIGMSKEAARNVFEKFYRAHTGNVHNVKGFGLGMSYVKTVVDAMDGNISVESTLGKGTKFIVSFSTDK